MTEENTIPFYKRREFRYLAIACTALIVTAVGAVFYNKHPRPAKKRNNTVIKADSIPAGHEVGIMKTDSVNYQAPDSVYTIADSSAITQ